MNHHGNNPRYRFDNTPPPPPSNETKEDRVKRLLKTMPPSVNRNPALIPGSLKTAIAREEAAKPTPTK